VQPVIANPCRTVVRQLNSAKFQDLIGSQFIVVRMADAVHLCQVPPLLVSQHALSWGGGAFEDMGSVRCASFWVSLKMVPWL